MLIKATEKNKTIKVMSSQKKASWEGDIWARRMGWILCVWIPGLIIYLSSQYLSIIYSSTIIHLGEEHSRRMLGSWFRSIQGLCGGIGGSLREQSGRGWSEWEVTAGGGWLGLWRPQEAIGLCFFSERDEKTGRVGGDFHFFNLLLTRGMKRPYVGFNEITLTGVWKKNSRGARARERGDQLRKPLQ